MSKHTVGPSMILDVYLMRQRKKHLKQTRKKNNRKARRRRRELTEQEKNFYRAHNPGPVKSSIWLCSDCGKFPGFGPDEMDKPCIHCGGKPTLKEVSAE